MAVILGHAVSDEFGKSKGGEAGNQTGQELRTQAWYPHRLRWIVLRPKDRKKAFKIAKNMAAACNNPLIGYDQSQNKTLYRMAEPLGFDCSRVNTPVETDCARLVRVCCAYAGIQAEDFYTATEPAALMATGQFIQFTDALHCESSDYLRVGDVLVTSVKGHTAVVLTDGPLAFEDEDLGTRTLLLETPSMKGSDVRRLQTLLISWNYSCGKWGADGDFGTDTMNAVCAWQMKNHLPADGIIDADDFKRIRALQNPQAVDTGVSAPPAVPVVAPTEKIVTVKIAALNIRTAPSLKGAILGIAAKGDTFRYADETMCNGWHCIFYESGVGWISGKYTVLSDVLIPIEE